MRARVNLPQVCEAISIYEPLVEHLPQRFGEQLLAAYRTLADVFDGLGHSEEAAGLRQQLALVTGDEPATE